MRCERPFAARSPWFYSMSSGFGHYTHTTSSILGSTKAWACTIAIIYYYYSSCHHRPIEKCSPFWLFVLLLRVRLPCPLLTLFPFVISIWLSSSCNSDFNSANLLLLFLTIEATSLSERRSVVTSRSFSAPSLICDVLGTWEKITKIPLSSFSPIFGIRARAEWAFGHAWHLTFLPWALFLFRVWSLLWFPPSDLEVHFLVNYRWIHICDSVHIKLDVLYNRPATIEKDKEKLLKKCINKKRTEMRRLSDYRK